MARGTFNFAANFQVKLQDALDPRVVVSAKSDLINKETWPYDGDTLYLYNGLIVSAGTDGVFRLIDVDKALEADYSGWEAVGGVSIIDNLESDATDAALSAAQGKVLMSEINTLAGKLQGIYSYKGSVDTYELLPTEGLTAGDVYNVVAEVVIDSELDGKNYPAGTNFAWTGDSWDALGGSIDLSAYLNAEEVAAAIKVETDRATAEEERLAGLITTLQSSVDTNTSNINTLSTGLSSANEEIAKKVDAVEGSSLISSDKLALIDTNAADIATLKDTDTTLDARLKTVESMIGDGGEVDLSSLTDLVNQHGTRITALETDNATNKSDISTLKTQVSEIVTVNTEQSAQLSTLSTDLSTVKTTADNNTTALATLSGTVNGHTSEIADIKSSIDGLAVKSVNSDDKVLAANESGVLSTTIALKYDSESKKIQLTGIAETVVSEFDASEFIKDGMIDSVVYDPDTKVMTITWNTDAGKEATEVDMTGLVDTYTAGSGLKVESNEFSVKLDTNTNNLLTVSETGLLVDKEVIESTIDTKIADAFAWEEVV